MRIIVTPGMFEWDNEELRDAKVAIVRALGDIGLDATVEVED